jgi:hypothetical protein
MRRRGVILTAWAIVLLPSPAYAYIDPGFGALLWQALVAAALGGAYYLYRTVESIRSFVRRLGRRLIGRASAKQ